MKNQPLTVTVDKGLVTISIGVSTLCYAILHGDDMEDVKITDEDAFVKDFLTELDREDEEGSNPLHKLFDKMANEAINNGALGVEISEGD